jgi:hypothetical protein
VVISLNATHIKIDPKDRRLASRRQHPFFNKLLGGIPRYEFRGTIINNHTFVGE